MGMWGHVYVYVAPSTEEAVERVLKFQSNKYDWPVNSVIRGLRRSWSEYETPILINESCSKMGYIGEYGDEIVAAITEALTNANGEVEGYVWAREETDEDIGYENDVGHEPYISEWKALSAKYNEEYELTVFLTVIPFTRRAYQRTLELSRISDDKIIRQLKGHHEVQIGDKVLPVLEARVADSSAYGDGKWWCWSDWHEIGGHVDTTNGVIQALQNEDGESEGIIRIGTECAVEKYKHELCWIDCGKLENDSEDTNPLIRFVEDEWNYPVTDRKERAFLHEVWLHMNNDSYAEK